MNLLSNSPFWPEKSTHQRFPQLHEDISTEIVIMGGGITGALVALAFHQAGFHVVVVDKRRIAHGSTSASTALLQYEIDVPLHKLISRIGRQDAERVYHLCGNAIHSIKKIASQFACEFEYQPSIYFAKDIDDLADLKKEFNARKDAGFEVSWLEDDDLQKTYGIHSPGAIRSELGASINPYRCTYNIFEYLYAQGVPIFEETRITTINTQGGVTLTSQNGHMIKAKHLVFATGYETQQYLREKVVDLQSTYCLISEPVLNKPWKDDALLWNTDNPYLYARLTEDNRIIVGGGDIPLTHPWLRDALIYVKTKHLEHQFKQFLPEISFSVKNRWAGVFGETTDGLAYIGTSPEWSHASFALGFGGNGITYSALAAELLLKQYQGKTVDDLRLFRFGR